MASCAIFNSNTTTSHHDQSCTQSKRLRITHAEKAQMYQARFSKMKCHTKGRAVSSGTMEYSLQKNISVHTLSAEVLITYHYKSYSLVDRHLHH